jgi:hypothetical protein
VQVALKTAMIDSQFLLQKIQIHTFVFPCFIRIIAGLAYLGIIHTLGTNQVLLAVYR